MRIIEPVISTSVIELLGILAIGHIGIKIHKHTKAAEKHFQKVAEKERKKTVDGVHNTE